MPRFFAAEGEQMSVLRAAVPGGRGGGEEAVPVVRRAGVQEHSRGRGPAGPEKDSEDHGVRGVREAGVGRVKPQPPLGLNSLGAWTPRVARPSQPWAVGRNPFGIGRVRLRLVALTREGCFVVFSGGETCYTRV